MSDFIEFLEQCEGTDCESQSEEESISEEIARYEIIRKDDLFISIEEEIEDDDSIYDIFCKQYFRGWTEELSKRISVLQETSKIIAETERKYGEFYPLRKNLFNAFRTDLDNVKVVIWGQDPYPQKISIVDKNDQLQEVPRARGYSFSVSKDDKIPGSLKTIYKEIKENFPMFHVPEHGDLTPLAREGVLFLNTSLTYFPGEPKAGLKLWIRFINVVIEILNESGNNCIHVLWGNHAQKLAEHIRGGTILTSAHPSPMSAYRFKGNKHFYQINKKLHELGKEEINWNKLNSNWKELIPTTIKELYKFHKSFE